jgi:hypothetical protein
MPLSRKKFEILWWVLGICLGVIPLAVVATMAVLLIQAMRDSSVEFGKTIKACSDLFTILGITLAGIWLVIRLAFRREYDSAVELDVATNQLPAPMTHALVLTASLRNVTEIAAGIERLEWAVYSITPEGGTEVARGAWKQPSGCPPILTRNSKWQLTEVARLPADGAYKLIANCRIGMQPDEQALHYEKVFTVSSTV